jgi:uncharacterized membrane protein
LESRSRCSAVRANVDDLGGETIILERNQIVRASLFLAMVRRNEERKMLKYVVAYVATAVVFFGLDFIWLSTLAERFYRANLGDLLAVKPNLFVSALFYLIYVAGVVVFVIDPVINGHSWATAMFLGACLGLIAYGTYDLTNLATINDWPAIVSVVDILWGVSVTSISATLGYLITTTLVGKL